MRSGLYRLLARALAAPADADLLRVLAGLGGDDTPLGQAVGDLAALARETDAEAARAEFGTLFIGMAGGVLTPYASYYLTGFLHEKPLARLRAELAALGVAKAEGVGESEDHIAALMEAMAGLIEGAFGAPAPLAEQRRFFEAHIAPWAGHFFNDLSEAEPARLYAPLGRIGSHFMDIEAQSLALA